MRWPVRQSELTSKTEYELRGNQWANDELQMKNAKPERKNLFFLIRVLFFHLVVLFLFLSNPKSFYLFWLWFHNYVFHWLFNKLKLSDSRIRRKDANSSFLLSVFSTTVHK